MVSSPLGLVAAAVVHGRLKLGNRPGWGGGRWTEGLAWQERAHSSSSAVVRGVEEDGRSGTSGGRRSGGGHWSGFFVGFFDLWIGIFSAVIFSFFYFIYLLLFYFILFYLFYLFYLFSRFI